MNDSTWSDSAFRQTEICSDCLERGDVDLIGRVPHDRVPSVADCAGCGVEQGRKRGNGRQTRARVEVVSWWVSNRERLS